MKRWFIVGVTVLLTVSVLVACYVIYLWGSYIDETIISGTGYGFKIGDTKEQVYDVAGKLFKSKEVFILYPVDDQGYGPDRQITFGSEEYALVENRDSWKFYFGEGYFDSICLTFEGGHLKDIYRHRTKFELP